MVTEAPDKISTIQLRVTVKERLSKLGSKDETYEEIIKRLLDQNDKLKSQVV